MKCLCATTRRAARAVTRLYERHLGPVELSAAQFELLGHLAARPGVAQSVLAEALALDQTTLSRNLKVLTARGCITRSASSKDRRQTCYTLSAAGTTLFDEALPLWNAAQHEMRQRLGPAWSDAWPLLEHLSGTLSA